MMENAQSAPKQHTVDLLAENASHSDSDSSSVDEADLAPSTPRATYADVVNSSSAGHDKWKKVLSKRRTRSDNHAKVQSGNYSDYTIGTANQCSIKVAAGRTTKTTSKKQEGVFISRLERTTTAASIAAHVYSKTGITITPEKLKTKYDSYSSFLLPVRKGSKDFDCLLKSHLWPKGCLVKQFRA